MSVQTLSDSLCRDDPQILRLGAQGLPDVGAVYKFGVLSITVTSLTLQRVAEPSSEALWKSCT